jgi:hypothetical protein
MGGYRYEANALRVGQVDERLAHVMPYDDGGLDPGPSLPQTLAQTFEVVLRSIPGTPDTILSPTGGGSD